MPHHRMITPCEGIQNGVTTMAVVFPGPGGKNPGDLGSHGAIRVAWIPLGMLVLQPQSRLGWIALYMTEGTLVSKEMFAWIQAACKDKYLCSKVWCHIPNVCESQPQGLGGKSSRQHCIRAYPGLTLPTGGGACPPSHCT